MPDEHPIGIRIEGEQPPITVGAVINLSSPNDHANLLHAPARNIIGAWTQREKAAEISN